MAILDEVELEQAEIIDSKGENFVQYPF